MRLCSRRRPGRHGAESWRGSRPDQFAIDPLLFDALDDAAQLGSRQTDVLAPLCSAEFTGADLHSGPAPEEWLAAVAELRRMGLLISALRVQHR